MVGVNTHTQAATLWNLLAAAILLIYENQNQIKSFIILVIRQSFLRVGGAHTRVIAPAVNTVPFQKMSQRWRAVDSTTCDLTKSSLFHHMLKSKQAGNSDKIMQSSQLHLLAILNSYRHKLKLVIEHKTQNIINNVTA